MPNALLSWCLSQGCSGSRVRGAACNQNYSLMPEVSARGCECASHARVSDNSFHPAYSPLVCGMNARGRSLHLSRIPRFSRIAGFRDSQSRASGSFSISEHAPEIFHADHHGTAEQQNCTDNRVRREWRDPSRTGKCSHRGAGRRQRRASPSLPTIQRRAGA